MAGISASIGITDRMSSAFLSITNAINMTLYAFEDVRSGVEKPFQTTAIDDIRNQVNAATMAIRGMENEYSNISGGQNIKVPVTPEWQTQARMDIFDGGGTDRLNNEIIALDSILSDVLQNQKLINEQSMQMDVLPSNAVFDIEETNQRVTSLGQKLATLQNQDVSFMDDSGIERMNSDIEGMRSMLLSVVNIQEQMNQALESGDLSTLNNGYNQLNGIVVQVDKNIRSSMAAIQAANNVSWSSPQNIAFFDGNGIERYKQEIQSANQMMRELTQCQQQISSQASNIKLFPANMQSDLLSMDSRVTNLQNKLQQLTNQKVSDIGAVKANSEMEGLRNKINQALQIQQSLNSAVNRMDVSAANTAYNQLNSVVSATETNIRDNISAQQLFNDEIQQGQSMMGGLRGKITAAVAAYASLQGIEKVLGLSDKMSNITARINLMNDGMQSTKQLQDSIFLAAERSRSSYQSMTDVVSKLGQRAGDAFNSNAETIRFAENLNKQFVIAGASQEEISSASLQLTQALGSGVLRGEEFNAVFESAPNVIQTIADYMNEPIGKLRNMASDGKLTADIVKNAMLGATDEINQKFDSMPKTFAQIATSIQNNALVVFQPILDRLRDIANSEGFALLVNNLITCLAALGEVAVFAFDGICNAVMWLSSICEPVFQRISNQANYIVNNWSKIAPTISFVATCFLILAAAVAGYHAVMLLVNIAMAIFKMHVLTNPIFWLILGFVSLVAAIYGVINWYNKLTGATDSAMGTICGIIGIGAAFIGNLFVTLINFAIDIFVVLWNFIASFANFFANVFIDPVGAIARLFFDLVDTVLSLLQSLASAIDTIFGSNLASGVQGWRNNLGGWVDKKFGKGIEVMAKMNSQDMHLGRFEYGEAYDFGYNVGKGIDDKIAKFNPADLVNGLGKNIPNPMSANDVTANLPTNVENIDKNTKKASDSLEISSEDLKYLRDIATQKAVNRFTTAKISIDMKNDLNVNSEQDIDGIIDYMAGTLEDKMTYMANATHA